MRKIWYCLLSLIFIIQMTGCTHHEPLSQKEAKKLLDATIIKIEDALGGDLENVPVSIRYSNTKTNETEDANISPLGKQYFRHNKSDYNLFYKDGLIYKKTNANKITKKEFNYESLTFPKIVTNTEMITLIGQILNGDYISSYSAEIYDYTGYNLTIQMDSTKIEKLRIPFQANSLSIRSYSTLEDNKVNTYSVTLEFSFSTQEQISYEYFKPRLFPDEIDTDSATYDPNLTFELPNHDHLLNK